MSSSAPTRCSPRLAEKQLALELQKKFRNQIADLYDTIARVGTVINNDDGSMATWTAVSDLIHKCEDDCIDLSLGYRTTDPAIKAASVAFKKLVRLPGQIDRLCRCALTGAPLSDEQYELLCSKHSAFLHGVEDAAKIALSI